MYWWNVSKLAQDLREGRVDEKERFKYFLATFLTSNMAVQLFIYYRSPFSMDDLILATINLIAAGIGITLCYKVNKSGDNNDFIPRMICLSWPFGIQLAAMSSVVLLIPSVIFSSLAILLGKWSYLSKLTQEIRERWDTIPGILFVTSFYFGILWNIAYVARAREVINILEMTTGKLSDAEAAVAFLGLIGLPISLGLVYFMASNFIGSDMVAQILTYLASGLYLLLFGWIFIWMLRRRSSRPSG